MLAVNIGLVVVGLCLAPVYSTWPEALLIGGSSLIALFALRALVPGSALSRVAMAAGLMIMAALHIHQLNGMIEMHFSIFILLAILLYYRDWLPIVVAAAVIAVHHLVFYYLQASGAGVWILPTVENGWWIIFLHAGYVVAESMLLVYMSVNLRREYMQSSELMELTAQIVQSEELNLAFRSSGTSDLLRRFDSYTEAVAGLARHVRLASETLNDDGTSLGITTKKMAAAVQAQKKSADRIALAIGEFEESIGEVGQNAEDAAASVHRVDDSAKESAQVSRKTSADMGALAEKISKASDTINEMHTRSSSIGSVLDVIRGIADQTNLLALNAAIEAARAGEQGRGFAVVADEVRTLAKRTQDSTEQIDAMIEALQQGSQQSVAAIEASQSHVRSCVVNTEESLHLMEQVSTEINAISITNSRIVIQTKAQAAAAKGISANLNDIITAIAQSVNESGRASRSSEAVIALSTELKQITTKFRLD
jgi:methyl-accepting chemotaxis protein